MWGGAVWNKEGRSDVERHGEERCVRGGAMWNGARRCSAKQRGEGQFKLTALQVHLCCPRIFLTKYAGER